jgi:hypothetical protein
MHKNELCRLKEQSHQQGKILFAFYKYIFSLLSFIDKKVLSCVMENSGEGSRGIEIMTSHIRMTADEHDVTCVTEELIAKRTDDVEFMFVRLYNLFLHFQQKKMAH